MYKLITSEAVLPGHPDKVCDQIADAILDETIKLDKYCHNAVEVSIKDNFCFIFGETSHLLKDCDYIRIAENVLKSLGYGEKFDFKVLVSKQSSEINSAVENTKAGDQGIMFGYACDDTENYLPASIYYANKLSENLYELTKRCKDINTDGKTQITARYKDGEFLDISEVLVSISHSKYITLNEVRNKVMEEILNTFPADLIAAAKIVINPAGSWTNCGSYADSGTTGRKIVCDSYGGVGRVGGGCFSSKDPTKVDRSGAYYCRYVAKSLVAAGLCRKCEVGVSYAIGVEGPVSIEVNSFGTGDDEVLLKVIKENFNFNVENIINELDLRRPIYRSTSNFGHFGKEEYSWEKVKEVRR